MSIDTAVTNFGAALRERGVDAAIERRESLAVLRSHDLTAIAARRREIAALARTCGFTHVCVELHREETR